MTKRELLERQKRIDKGILLSQRRMLDYARRMDFTLVVYRNGKILDLKPEELAF